MKGGLRQYMQDKEVAKQERGLSRSFSQSSMRQKPQSLFSSHRKNYPMHNNSEETDYESYIGKRKRLDSNTSNTDSHRKKSRITEEALQGNESWTGRTHFSNARKEMREYIVKLSTKLKIELGEAMATLEQFNRNIKRTVDSEYSRIQESIIEMVESLWRESEKDVLRLVKEKTKGLIKEMAETTQQMEIMQERLKSYEKELSGDNWKRAMREIVSFDIEEEVNSLMEKSQDVRRLKSFKLGVNRQKLGKFRQSLEDILSLDVELEGGKPKFQYLRAR